MSSVDIACRNLASVVIVCARAWPGAWLTCSWQMHSLVAPLLLLSRPLHPAGPHEQHPGLHEVVRLCNLHLRKPASHRQMRVRPSEWTSAEGVLG